ncbi:MAG: ATP-dependent helicase [Flavobacteriales bacterium]|nr:ATP-dependent helicase [Flavobacteriales bacterium]
MRTLREQPIILRALARRYPHIIVDEAQDIGSVHAALLDLLVTAGVQVSLIGDTAQAIFEFAGADGGSYLSSFSQPEFSNFPLTRNYRSNDRILLVANRIANRNDSPDHVATQPWEGAYFASYANLQESALVDVFQTAVASGGIPNGGAVVVCRSRDLLRRLAGTDVEFGKGAVVKAARASLLRDVHGDIPGAYKALCAVVFALLSGYADETPVLLRKHSNKAPMRPLRILLWKFLRDSGTGLPSASLHATNDSIHYRTGWRSY